jgi:hypothetical protein
MESATSLECNHLVVMVHVIPSIGSGDLLLRHPQVADCRVGMPTELPVPAIVTLRLLNVLNGLLSGAIRIPEIGMMDFIGKGYCCDQNCAQRSNDDLIHDPLSVVNAVIGSTASILDYPADRHITARTPKVELGGCRFKP